MKLDVAPDIEAKLRAEATGRGVTIDAVLREALAAYVSSTKRARAGTGQGGKNRDAEMTWFLDPDPQFVGQWVVLDGSSVVASGDSALVAYQKAKAAGVDTPFVAFISPHRDEPFAGGWLD